MLIVDIPLADFYRICRAAGRKSQYQFLITLISRHKDHRNSHEELLNDWPDFHGLSGSKILVLIPNPESKDISNGSDSKIGAFSSSHISSLGISEDLPHQYELLPEFEHLVERFRSPQLKDEAVLKNYGTMVSELRDYLNLTEMHIPCLHITNLLSNQEFIIRLGEEDSFYKVLKRFYTTIEFDLNRIDRVKNLSDVESTGNKYRLLLDKLKLRLEYCPEELKSSLSNILEIVKKIQKSNITPSDSINIAKECRKRLFMLKLNKAIDKKIESHGKSIIDSFIHIMESTDGFTKYGAYRADVETKEHLGQYVHAMDENIRRIAQAGPFKTADGRAILPTATEAEQPAIPKKKALIVTALPSETAAVMAILDDPGKVDTPLLRARKGSYRNWEVVVVTAGQGNEPTAALTQHFMDRFQPECAFFVGVAGGRKDVKHLDVVIGNQVFNVQSGKSSSEGFKSRPEAYRANTQFLSIAADVAAYSNWRERATDPDVQAHVGHIAVTDGVVSDPGSDLGALMGDNYGHTLAVEMEGFGFQLVAHLNPMVKSLIVRGISDLLEDKNPERDAELQPKAARNAAAFVFSMLDDLLMVDQTT